MHAILFALYIKTKRVFVQGISKNNNMQIRLEWFLRPVYINLTFFAPKVSKISNEHLIHKSINLYEQRYEQLDLAHV